MYDCGMMFVLPGSGAGRLFIKELFGVNFQRELLNFGGSETSQWFIECVNNTYLHRYAAFRNMLVAL